jgi:hypothetical protein
MNKTSGAGSYGKIAKYKANVVNSFVEEHGIESVIDFGCGDGNQLEYGNYPSYLGLDVSKKAIEICKDRFDGDPTKAFMWYSPHHFHDPSGFISAEMTLSLEVIFHLLGDEMFELYMSHLFGASERFVVILAPDGKNERVPNNTGPHVKIRRFTEYVEAQYPGWTLIEKRTNRFPDDSISDFFFYKFTGI